MGPPPVFPRPTSCPRGMLSHTPSSACMPQLDRWVSSVSTWRLVRCPKDTPRLLGLALEAPHNLPPPYCCCHRMSPPPHAMLPPHPPITPPPPGQPDSTPEQLPQPSVPHSCQVPTHSGAPGGPASWPRLLTTGWGAGRRLPDSSDLGFTWWALSPRGLLANPQDPLQVSLLSPWAPSSVLAHPPLPHPVPPKL